jgi:hypothetical protein
LYLQHQHQHQRQHQRSQYQSHRRVFHLMVDSDRLSYPLPKQLSNAGITKVFVEPPYLVTYCKDQTLGGERPLFLVNLSGYYRRDLHNIRFAAQRVLTFQIARLLTYHISISEYFQNQKSNERALQKLRDLAAYEVAKPIINSSSKYGIDKKVLSKIIEEVVDVSSNEAYRIIERFKKSGKLLESSYDYLVLG